MKEGNVIQRRRGKLREKVFFNDWTPEKLRETRKNLGLSTYDIAEVMQVTGTTVANIENGRNTSPIAIQLYGIVLERYWAYERGYVPAYRKVGQNKYYEGVMI